MVSIIRPGDLRLLEFEVEIEDFSKNTENSWFSCTEAKKTGDKQGPLIKTFIKKFRPGRRQDHRVGGL